MEFSVGPVPEVADADVVIPRGYVRGDQGMEGRTGRRVGTGWAPRRKVPAGRRHRASVTYGWYASSARSTPASGSGGSCTTTSSIPRSA